MFVYFIGNPNLKKSCSAISFLPFDTFQTKQKLFWICYNLTVMSSFSSDFEIIKKYLLQKMNWQITRLIYFYGNRKSHHHHPLLPSHAVIHNDMYIYHHHPPLSPASFLTSCRSLSLLSTLHLSSYGKRNLFARQYYVWIWCHT